MGKSFLKSRSSEGARAARGVWPTACLLDLGSRRAGSLWVEAQPPVRAGRALCAAGRGPQRSLGAGAAWGTQPGRRLWARLLHTWAALLV